MEQKMKNTMISDKTGTTVSDLELIDALQQMRTVLERENSALLTGDAVLVGELADEKLRLSTALDNMRPTGDSVAREVRRLGMEVREMANSNHLLIEHMHQYYTGIMSMMIKMNGQTQTYGQHGYINRPAQLHSPTRREIIA
jgi:flagellar biosynthesis/type III secretory pathway chaperone